MHGATAAGLGLAAGAPPDVRVTVRLLATSDLHGRVLSFDYANEQPMPGAGLEAAARRIAQLRREGPRSLLLDAGDFLFGSAMDDLALDHDWDEANPVVAAMNAIGYDAVALGNHELDYGLEPLARALSQAAFPVLCSNVSPLTDPRTDGPLAASRTDAMLSLDALDGAGRAHTLSVGIVSFLPLRQIEQCRAKYPQIADLAVQEVEQIAALRVRALRAAGADLVVALCHDGMDRGDPARPGSPLDVVRGGGVDAVIMGHQHALFPRPPTPGASEGCPGIDRTAGRLAGVPAVMPGCWGRHVGVIDLALERGEGGAWHVVGSDVSLHSTASDEDHGAGPQLPAIVRKAHVLARQRDNQVLGQLSRPATSYFARLGLCPGTMLLAAVLRDTVRAEMGAGCDLPVIGLAAPFQAGGAGGPENYTDIPAGPLRMEHLAATHPFPDRICAVEVTGAEIRDWFERGAAGFHQIGPDGTGLLVDEGLPGSDIHFGPDLLVEMDLSVPALFSPEGRRVRQGPGRVRSMLHDGAELTDATRVLIAVTEYRAAGGGGFPGCLPERVRWRSAGSVRNAMVARARAALSPRLRCAAFRLHLPAGADPVFVTGAGVMRYPRAIREAGLIADPDGAVEGGWLRCYLLGGARGLDVARSETYVTAREVGAGKHLANPVRSGRKQP